MFRLSPRRQTLLALFTGGAVALLWALGATDPFERPLSDLWLRLPRPGAGAATPVAAVLIDDAAVAAAGPLPWPRERLAALVERLFALRARAVVVDLILSEAGEPARDRALSRALARGPALLAAAGRPDGGWLLPREGFGGALHAGHVEAEIGPDGVVRTLPATRQWGELALPALSLAAARLVEPEIPVIPGALLRPDFRLAPQEVPRISAVDLLTPAPPSLPLAGRLVFLGISAAGAGDQFVAPTGGRRAWPGVLLHASATASILRGGLLRPLPAPAVFAACLLLAGLAQVARSRTGRLGVGHLAVAVAALVAFALLALWGAGLQVPVVTLTAALGLSALVREGIESELARRRTGEILQRLAAESAEGGELSPAPRGAAGRLQVVEALQARLIRDRNLRSALLDGLEDGVVRWDGMGEPLLVNAAARRLWGGAPRRREVEAAEGGGDEAGRVLRRGGRELRVTVQPLAEGHLGLIRDVTAERELESRRREMQRLVSHELKTPLASLAGFGSMLERYHLSEEELARVAGMIRRESERLLEMVSTFLDLERLGSGRLAPERAELDLAELARERYEVLAAATAGDGRTLTFQARGPARVRGDRQLLARVLDNLVGNALKYSPAGGEVAIELLVAGPRVELRVRDEGPGIPPEALPHLFERFYRVPGSGAGGSGLGLALVREISEWHGGCVRVDSEPGRGSTFTVELPALILQDEGEAQ